MHIGVDLDNTVLDATSAYLHYYNMVSGLSLTPDDVNDFYLYRLYGWDEEERDAIYNKHGHDIHWNSSPLPMAVEILQELSDQHQISIITARPLFFRDVTIYWLKNHNIHFNNITFTENKLQECMNSKVILFEQPYNLSVTNDLIYRATNWFEVKRHIDYLKSRLG
ncbi:5' nucleotidase, NT5C type [Paenibacillus sp. GYB003]|uniref:5' nucleotidase, NT5C type n=1 Tax=Paenibacillus sp. GYB003 TaxID=2994392 RepID=UPI002F96CBF5